MAYSQRVAELSRALAQRIGLPDEQCERVYLSGLLHDVGKIGVPETVLTKPGRLTEAEFDAIKKHPAIGAQILGNIKQLQDIIPGVLYHHERWDGRGYPHQVAGDKIPLMGRIICVADSFDAMSSTRTYRPALPLETVLAEIQRCAGQQFDPQLAKVFVTLDFSPYKQAVEEQSAALQASLSVTEGEPGMNIRCEDYDHVTVVGVAGEFNSDSTDVFRKHIDERLARKVRFFVIDLEQTTFIDSKGLESLLWVQQQCDENLGQVRLCKPDDTCRKILQVTRLDGRFDVFADVTEAVKTMR